MNTLLKQKNAAFNKLKAASYNFMAWAEGFEPPKCQDQNLVPYHLATPKYSYIIHQTWSLCEELTRQLDILGHKEYNAICKPSQLMAYAVHIP